MKRILLTLLCAITLGIANGQVGIGTNTPSASAILELQSSDKGFLPPRMSAANRIALPSPVNGLVVFDNDSSTLFLYQQTGGWRKMLPVSNLGSIIAGTSAGDLLVWNGTAWVVTPKCNLFNFYFRDKDGDGKGDRYSPLMACVPIAGFVADSLDCDDNNALVGLTKQYRDADGDGAGDNNVSLSYCTIQTGYVLNNFDCNDTDPTINPSNPDLPDDGFSDANCDGIDGKESAAIFVSPLGNDANAGTKSSPVKTIGVGITKAAAAGKTQVLVAAGTYNETVTMQSGISIYGGYSNIWVRAASNVATIIGQPTAPFCGVNASGITNATIDRFSITGPNATGATGSTANSSYGIYSSGIATTTIKNCKITAGQGAAGIAGAAGVTGANGGNGSLGEGGSCDNANGGGGGAGGISTCGRTGGNGGTGGYNSNGSFGGTGVGNTSGGQGGILGNPGSYGIYGNFGSAGTNGSGGAGATIAVGATVNLLWAGSTGSVGGTGTGGNGGGGGGGGGGQNGFLVTPGRGNGGSGGGAGGCPGGSGAGGIAGGGSIAIFFATMSPGIVITNNILISGAGGAGGTGGAGAVGGAGGAGGGEVNVCTAEVGGGAGGGGGGIGGKSAGGGGGAGGISYGIYTSPGSFTSSGNTFTIGTGGGGGSGGSGATGAANPGTAGVAGSTGNTYP